MAIVKAVRAGYAGAYREPGEVFEWAGALGSWMEPVKARKGGKQVQLLVPDTESPDVESVDKVVDFLSGDGDDQGSEV